MPLLKRKTILAAKAETTSGTAVTLAAADAVFNVFDASLTYDVDMTERIAQGSLSNLPAISGARKGKLTFMVEASGSGSSGAPTPQWATTFLTACGWLGSSGVFSPTSTVASMTTLTMALYLDGLFKSIKGAAGTWSFDASAGKHGAFRFEFTGCYVGPTDVAAITPTYPTVLAPRWATSTLTIGSYTPAPCSKISIAANNTIHLREDPTDGTGYRSAIITGRSVKGSIDPETPLVAGSDLWTAWTGNTEAALSCSIGATAGNVVTITAPKLQYTSVQPGDRDGVLTENIGFQCNKSAAAGNDELVITFT